MTAVTPTSSVNKECAVMRICYHNKATIIVNNIAGLYYFRHLFYLPKWIVESTDEEFDSLNTKEHNKFLHQLIRTASWSQLIKSCLCSVDMTALLSKSYELNLIASYYLVPRLYQKAPMEDAYVHAFAAALPPIEVDDKGGIPSFVMCHNEESEYDHEGSPLWI